MTGEDKNQRDHVQPQAGCPRCGSVNVKPIVYGFVDVSAYLELGRRAPDIELGGLVPRAENRCCGQCGHKWAGG